MRHSTDRILVSHAGTLPTPEDLAAAYAAQPRSEAQIQALLPGAVEAVVDRQARIGIDIVNDGEFVERGGFGGYIHYRLSGFEYRTPGPGERAIPNVSIPGSAGPKDRAEFAEYWDNGLGWGYTAAAWNVMISQTPTAVTAPIEYIGQDVVAEDLKNLLAAAGKHDLEAVMPSTLPQVGGNVRNDYYTDRESMLVALADALHEEYKAITDAGVVLQLDNPGIASAAQGHADLASYKKAMAPQIEMLNYALRDIPVDMVRMHTCWGGNHGPHKNDVPLADLIETILEVNVGCYNIEQSNGRHAHEWHIWEDIKLPDGKIFMPGVVGHATDIVEHPELVADRLCDYASLLGRENVMGGTDCGISARVGDQKIAWAKLASLAEGARIATKRLWK